MVKLVKSHYLQINLVYTPIITIYQHIKYINSYYNAEYFTNGVIYTFNILWITYKLCNYTDILHFKN